ncbi:MAG: hypothetical protein B6U95_00480 [Thermofilum sp. ex4484_82]|nr:MAG: hypothetical protein B6U95_00480 [Thermofilum sp. ex4484_82]OYT40023.1 MAG: hypothetical protein B6U96_00485 [Archaeoglobales archaeon ex4484_92]
MHFIDMLLKKPTTFRILKALLRNPEIEMTKYALKKQTGIEHIKSSLKTLVSLGLISEIRYGRASKYKVNLDDYRVKAIKDFFEKTSYLDG